MIGRRLREIIQKQGLAYRKIAQDLGLDHGNLYRSLKDDGNPEWNTVTKLLDYLGYDFKLRKRKDVKRDMMSMSRRSFENLNEKIHENLQKLFQSRIGDNLTAGQIKRLYKEDFKYPDVGWVQASDHAKNMRNKGACWCAETDEAIFERISRGVYKVR
jgi:transcriptional regulator with XRE-family HTH domain